MHAKCLHPQLHELLKEHMLSARAEIEDIHILSCHELPAVNCYDDLWIC